MRIQPARLPPDGLRPMCLVVRPTRLDFVEELIAAYGAHAVAPFRGVWVRPEQDRAALIPPPVVEVHAGRMVIVDGVHRIYCALRSGWPAVWVAVVSGVAQALPADVLEWSEVEVTGRQMPRSEKLRNLDESRFREVKRWLRGPG